MILSEKEQELTRVREENKGMRVELEKYEEETKRQKETYRAKEGQYNICLKEIRDKEQNFNSIVA